MDFYLRELIKSLGLFFSEPKPNYTKYRNYDFYIQIKV